MLTATQSISSKKFPLLKAAQSPPSAVGANNYNVYRCPDPLKVKTDEPWYPISNVCPCNPMESNVTGRGYTPCNFGIQDDQKEINSLSSKKSTMNNPLMGSLYQMHQYTPPQLNPYPVTRIGQQWRNPY